MQWNTIAGTNACEAEDPTLKCLVLEMELHQ